MQDRLEMLIPDIQKLAIGARLNRGADIFLADQTHFPEHLASLEGGDGDTGIVEDINLPGDDDIKVAAGVAPTKNDIIFFAVPQIEVLNNVIEIVLIDVAEKGKIAQEMKDTAQMVADIVGFILFMHGSEVLQPDRACATGARKHAVGNLIGPFILNDNFGQITVEYFAAATVGG